MRIDRLLWQMRLTKTRGQAQALVATGHLRRNGQRVLRASNDVAAGDTLTIPLGAGVRVIEVVSLPVRRGPAPEAQACYRVLDGQGQSDLAGGKSQPPERGPAP
jgi:ribosome-associated heat shock protein Hsp15